VPEVLNLANAVIARNEGQIRKELRADRTGGKMLPALVALDNPGAQAIFIGQRILELIDEGVSLNEIAVLYRAHYHSLDIQMELTNRGIPFQVTSGLRFFEQAHVKDVAAFMKLVSNRQDEVSFMRLVKLVPGVGSASAGKLWSEWLKSPAAGADLSKPALHEVLHGLKVPKKAATTWEQFAWTLEELVDTDGKLMPPAMMISVIPSAATAMGEACMATVCRFRNVQKRARSPCSQASVAAKNKITISSANTDHRPHETTTVIRLGLSPGKGRRRCRNHSNHSNQSVPQERRCWVVHESSIRP
jgi:hypothetical protein